jgi:cell division protease FtsH
MSRRVQTLFFAVLLVVVILAEVLFLPPLTPDLPYSQFKVLVRVGQVADLKISTTTITGTLLTVVVMPETGPPAPAPPPHRFTTTRVEDPGLVQELEAHHIAFSGQEDRTGWC